MLSISNVSRLTYSKKQSILNFSIM